ncbi:MAG TPA: hypothetical protein VGQ46_23055 [Thermoanaerobaculia bacterium]|nr:hypothetical protein [Thermoanaerobaculia bacterium]
MNDAARFGIAVRHPVSLFDSSGNFLGGFQGGGIDGPWSAGCPVTVHNGDPLLRPRQTSRPHPMMRTTGVNIDAAGNIWTCNNWKPNFDNDTIAGNPGGDGMLIWVGLAKPRN